MTVVVDASAVAPFLIADEAEDRSERLLTLLTQAGALAPHHWRLEVANLGRMAVRRKRITRQELEKGLALLSDFRIAIDDECDRHSWGRTLALASDHDLTSYDAAYLELALRRELPLATFDRALLQAAPRVGVKVFRT